VVEGSRLRKVDTVVASGQGGDLGSPGDHAEGNRGETGKKGVMWGPEPTILTKCFGTGGDWGGGGKTVTPKLGHFLQKQKLNVFVEDGKGKNSGKNGEKEKKKSWFVGH